MKYLFILLISFLLNQAAFAQSKLPIIKATSKKVSIRDGEYLDKNAWTLSPKARPDIFTADRTRETKWVTFYTDIDSIRIRVKPGTKFNFIILLNGKDSCYTQIASAIKPENMLQGKIVLHDTIPFILTADDAIAVKAVINNTDTLKLHFDLSSFDFHFTKNGILKKTQLLSNQQDALAGKAVPNFNKLNKVFKLQMGSLIFNDPDVFTTTFTANDMDGRFGWNVFEGKQVEIDYNKNLLIIHSKLPGDLRGYVRSKMGFARSYPYVKGTFKIRDIKYNGNFFMDTGSAAALILDSAWLSERNFPKQLKLIKLSTLTDPMGNKFETRTVLSPDFKINGFNLSDIPTLLLSGRNPSGFEINYLGNDLLKRFNIILDFGKDYLYLKPNKLMVVKYKGN